MLSFQSDQQNEIAVKSVNELGNSLFGSTWDGTRKIPKSSPVELQSTRNLMGDFGLGRALIEIWLCRMTSRLWPYPIADPIREDAETLEYLRSEDVTLKIISGDNPVTVSHIARQAGFADYQAILTVLRSAMRSWRGFGWILAVYLAPEKLSSHLMPMGIRQLWWWCQWYLGTAWSRLFDCYGGGRSCNTSGANGAYGFWVKVLKFCWGRRVVNNIAHIAPIFLIKTVLFLPFWGLIPYCQYCFGRQGTYLVFLLFKFRWLWRVNFIEGFPPFILTFGRNIRPVENIPQTFAPVVYS